MNHVMLDLETLGTVADACIMSIGAVRFDLNSDEIDDAAFYASVSIDSNLQHKRRIQEDTLIWWMGQGDSAKRIFNEKKQILEIALESLSDWIGDRNHQVWSNGADFDLPMLAHAYRSLGMEVPWEFWNSNCFRTYKKLPGAKSVAPIYAQIKHHAMHDAMAQAQTLQRIHKAIFRIEKVTA